MKDPTARYRLSLALFFAIAVASTAVAEVPRFAAMLANGQRLEGKRFHDWQQRAQKPRLDGKELMNDGNPLLWLRDRRLQPGPLPTSYIEMISGDRLPGVVLQHESGDGSQWESLPPRFLVRPTVNVSPPHGAAHDEVRVVQRFVRRIVWQARAGSEQYQPGTLFYKDGRTLKFRAARFSGNRVKLLQATDQTSVAFRDIAQLHLPEEDPWQSYYYELAVLSPTCEHRLLQLESTEGLLATGSMLQFNCASQGDAGNSDNWFHAVQPAWCLDTLWTANDTIWMRRGWSPEQVPLSHIPPSRDVSRSIIATGDRHWRRNVNTAGDALQSATQSHGWGFGVHAYSELHFPLPEMATSFRTRVGLDDSVGSGGCVIARVFCDTIQSGPLFQSPHLVGSQALQDTQNKNIATQAKAGQSLILQVDPAHAGRPAKADPFDIRDRVDWLDPVVTLDRGQLVAEVESRVAARMPAFAGWRVEPSPEGETKWTSDFQNDDPEPGRLRPQLEVRKQPLSLRRELEVGPQDKWLVVSTYRRRGESQEPELSVWVDGIEVSAARIPLRNGQPLPTPLAVALAPYVGHTIDLEVRQLPTANPGFPPVFWHALTISDQLPMLYRAFEDDEEFTAAVDDAGQATAGVVSGEPYYGQRSLEIQPGDGATLNFPESLAIRGNPQFGEQRFMRFAIRKTGKGSVTVELLRANNKHPQAFYDTGVPIKKEDKQNDEQPATKRVLAWQADLPEQWVVITRDVYSDFGDGEITGIRLHVNDGEQAQLDHIYFARAADDLKLLPEAPAAALTNQDARRELARAVLEKGHPATVAILIDGRQATGVLVGSDGLVLTAGHVFGGPNRDCEIQLPTGQRLPAKTRGIHRGADLGIIQITDRMDLPLPGLSLHDGKEFPSNQLYVGFALEPFEVETPGAAAHVVALQRDFRETLLTDFRMDRATTGGPLLDREGRIIGTQIRDSRFGGFMYTKSYVARDNWERMKNGEVYDEWFPGSGPMLGVIIKSAPEGALVTEVFADSPAQQADVQVGDLLVKLEGHPVGSLEDVYRLLANKDPGQEVTADFTRGGQNVSKKIKLMPRVP